VIIKKAVYLTAVIHAFLYLLQTEKQRC